MLPKVATCRGCGLVLKGNPYHTGKLAYHPRTNKQCMVNFYGGFVCSSACDFRSSLEHEQTMPGHGFNKPNLSSFAMESYKRNKQNYACQ